MRGGGVNGCRRLPTGGRMGPELGIGVPGALDVSDVGMSIDAPCMACISLCNWFKFVAIPRYPGALAASIT